MDRTDWLIVSFVGCAIVTLVLILMGCSVEFTQRQKWDWFNRDHSKHVTNAVNLPDHD